MQNVAINFAILCVINLNRVVSCVYKDVGIDLASIIFVIYLLSSY